MSFERCGGARRLRRVPWVWLVPFALFVSPVFAGCGGAEEDCEGEECVVIIYPDEAADAGPSEAGSGSPLRDTGTASPRADVAPTPEDTGRSVPAPDAQVPEPDTGSSARDTGIQTSRDTGASRSDTAASPADTGTRTPPDTGNGSGGGFDAGGPAATVRASTIWRGRLGPAESDHRTVPFQIPSAAESFSVVVEPKRNDAVPALEALVGPGGTIFEAYNSGGSKTVFMERSPVRAGAFALTHPNAPGLQADPGGYTVTLSAESRVEAEVWLLTKQTPLSRQRDRVPVTFWFTPQQYLDAGRASGDSVFQGAVRWMQSTYKAAGITLGPLAYRDLKGGELRDLAVIDDDREMARLMDEIAASPRPGLHFVFIDHFNLGLNGTVLGRSYGIPGPPTHPATPTRGVVLPLHYMRNYSNLFAGAMAHEAGHYFGLFHTSEYHGGAHDPMTDTPECTAGRDQNGDGAVKPPECRGAGADNLMFWTHGNRAKSTLTPQQIRVIRLNATVQ